MRLNPFLEAGLSSIMLSVLVACGSGKTSGGSGGAAGATSSASHASSSAATGGGGSKGSGGSTGGGGSGGSGPDCNCACKVPMSQGGCSDICFMTPNDQPDFCLGASPDMNCAWCLWATCTFTYVQAEGPNPCL